MRDGLSKRQAEILSFLARFVAERSYPPCMREIGTAFGIASSSVHQHLEALARKGFIRRSARRSRSIEIVKALEYGVVRSREVPILGRIAAGRPLLADEHRDGQLTFPHSGIDGRPLYALRVVGDSMIGVGIMPGDFVIARYQEAADEGDIVVARLQNEATVKRLKRAGRYWTLSPENDAYEPIPIRGDDVRIQGRVIAVHRVLVRAR